jgi:hypothetical protein
VQHAIKMEIDFGGVTLQDMGIDAGDDAGGLDGDGGNLDGGLESEESEDEVVGGVGASLINDFGINEDQLRNELLQTPVEVNNICCTTMEHNNQQPGVIQPQASRPVRNNILPQRYHRYHSSSS